MRIGAFAYVGPEVTLGDGVELRPHAYVTGATELGEGVIVFPFAVVGEVPQDLKFGGERTRPRHRAAQPGARACLDPCRHGRAAAASPASAPTA